MPIAAGGGFVRPSLLRYASRMRSFCIVALVAGTLGSTAPGAASGTLRVGAKVGSVAVVSVVGMKIPRGDHVEVAHRANRQRLAWERRWLRHLAPHLSSALVAFARDPRHQLRLQPFAAGFDPEQRLVAGERVPGSGWPVLDEPHAASAAPQTAGRSLYYLIPVQQLQVVVAMARLPHVGVRRRLCAAMESIVQREAVLFRLQGADDETCAGLLLKHRSRPLSAAIRQALGERRWLHLRGLALHLALQAKDAKAALRLLRQGVAVDVRHKGRYNDVPLHQAAEAGLLEVAQMLLRKGARVDATNEFDRTPLFSAIIGANRALVALLIRRGAQVNYLSQRYWSPMHEAVAKGDVALLKILLAAGGNPRLRGPRQGAQTPLELAKSPAIKKLLSGAKRP